MTGAIARLAAWAGRRALRRYIRAQPDARGPGVDVTILLGSAWGMGGTIRATLNLAGQLAERHRVEILSFTRRREVPFFPFPPGVRVTALDDDRVDVTPPARRPVRDALRRRPSVLMPPEIYPFDVCSLWTDVRLARALRRRSGVVIGTRPALNLLLADLSPPGRVTIGHEHMHIRAHPRDLRRRMARTYPQLDAVVLLTEQDARDYARRVPGPRPTVIPNAVPELEGGQAALDGTTILAAGRLTRQKGFDLLIRAFADVAPAHPDWRLRICGEGPGRQALEGRVDQAGLADVVSLPGASEQLGVDMEQAALFVMSSRFEGFPLILLEAMSKGLPVVSFDCPTGPRDLIDDHRTGILVPPKDVDALAAAIRELLADDALRRRLGAAAAVAAKDYAPATLGARWEQLFTALADRRGG